MAASGSAPYGTSVLSFFPVFRSAFVMFFSSPVTFVNFECAWVLISPMIMPTEFGHEINERGAFDG